MELLVLVCCVVAVIAGPVQEPAYIGVQITTWNVNSKLPPENLVDVLGLQRDPDLVKISLQEAFPASAKDYNDLRLFREKWRHAVESILVKKGYVMVMWGSMQTITGGLYAKARHEDALSDLRSGALPTRGQAYGNKGGDWDMASLYGRRIFFMNGHFTHGEDNMPLRLEDFHIIHNKTNELYSDLEYEFWSGDFNFRLKDRKELTAEKIVDKIAKGQLNELLEEDELRSAMKEGKVFKHYKESEISFPPTYKFEVGTSRYDLSRRPAWTDRVLYRAAPGRDITTVYYGSISHLNISDHKPVEAFFRIPLGPKQNNSSIISLS